MKRKIFNILFALILALTLEMAALPTAGVEAASAWYVDGTYGTDNTTQGTEPGAAAFKTIQYAINAASPGDTINVAAGTYSENVNVNKSLTLQGAGSDVVTVTAASSSDHVFEVSADSVNITGFTAKNASGTDKAGIYLWENVDHCNISNNTASNNTWGISLQSFSANNTIANNTASNNGCGISLQSSSSNTIANNTASNNAYGISLQSFSANNTIANNTASNNGCGIFLQSSSSNTIANNTASNNSYGIYLFSSSTNTLEGNTIHDNGYGIYLSTSSSANTLEGNTIHDNGYGIYLDEEFSGNKVHYNNIVVNDFGINNTGTGTLDATNNWWGANDGPSFEGTGTGNGDKISANVDADPWLKLNISANPTSIVANGTSTSTITADMTKNSDNATTSGGHIPDGTEITFSTTGGTLGSASVVTNNGIATATLKSSTTPGTVTVSAAAPGYAPYNKASTKVTFTQAVPAGPASAAANTNLGAVNFSPSNGLISPITVISPGNMQYLPAGYSFPYGFFGFNISNLTPGGSAQVTINFPNPLPLGVKYFKIQNGRAVDCSSIMTRPEPYTIILRLTDGGVGDADGIANGTIVDPGGPAFPMSATPTSHQSSMPIMPQAPVQLSNINVKTAALSATKVSPGSQVTVTANVANTGTGNGSSLIKFYVNGSEEYSQPVTVNSGGSTTVTHDIIRNEPGTYTVYVNGTNAGSFTVDMFAGNDMLIYGIIALFTIGIIGTLYLLVRRRTD